MGHLMLIAEYVLVMLERYPRETLVKYAPLPEWKEYVRGRDNETKERDLSMLAGGKPAVAGSTQRACSKWQVDLLLLRRRRRSTWLVEGPEELLVHWVLVMDSGWLGPPTPTPQPLPLLSVHDIFLAFGILKLVITTKCMQGAQGTGTALPAKVITRY